MKKFLTLTSIFVLISLVLLAVIGRRLERDLPYYWGNVGLKMKIDHIRNSENYNTYFIGSSRTGQAIDPVFFDSLTHHSGKSFNLGLPGFQAPESYHFLEKFLEAEDHHNTKTIFLELTEMRSIDQNKFNVRGLYFWNLDYYKLVSSDHLSRFDLSGVTITSLNYLSKITKVGFVKPIIIGDKLKITQEKMLSEAIQNRAGYYIPPFPKKLDKGRLNELFLITKDYYNKPHEINYSDRHLKKLLDLISLTDDMGIRLIFILPPRLRANMLPLFDELPIDNKLDLCDPGLYPQFYSIENSRDAYHLNRKGAAEMTRILAEQLYSSTAGKFRIFSKLVLRGTSR